MTKIEDIFANLEKLTRGDGQKQFISSFLTNKDGENEHGLHSSCYDTQKIFIKSIIHAIDSLSTEIQNESTILISVKNQKLLRICYEIITSIGFSQCLLPGVGLDLEKRCRSAHIFHPINFTDEQKYELLTACTDFFIRSYAIPVLKNIILTLHLSDYLAALIQLSFAPLKKPGTYNNFVMTLERYKQLTRERKKYVETYEFLVNGCFQPTLMKELLVLQSVKKPPPPTFVKKVVAKEMSKRLLAVDGVLSLIRCFMETYDIDTGLDWRKIDLICKIVSAKHGTGSMETYLSIICGQIEHILYLNNTLYVTIAMTCIISLYEKYPESENVKNLTFTVYDTFHYDTLWFGTPPGTVALSPLEIEPKIKMLHAYLCTSKIDCPASLLRRNVFVLFMLGIECEKHDDLKMKLKEILVKCFVLLDNNDLVHILTECLFGKDGESCLLVEEYDAGLAIKRVLPKIPYPKDRALLYFLSLLKCCPDNDFLWNIFEYSLSTLMDLNIKRQMNSTKESISSCDEPTIFSETDGQYITILQLLSELSTMPKILSSLKSNLSTVLTFVEHFILNNRKKSDEECVTISLVLLNLLLSNLQLSGDLKERFEKLIPVLQSLSGDYSPAANVLCTEALSLIMSGKTKQGETTEFQKAMSDVFDELLPVRAHGIIALTKLIENKDLETISKKHFVFCLLQEFLKDIDSYIYLAAINGIAALGTYCPEDVLQVLCKEYLQLSMTENDVETGADQNKTAELRMKIGDVIVKVTKSLGEMAIVHKTILLNTVLCACRDEDPFIRTSALSNLAEICLVLNYTIGSIIYEVLLCVWSILGTDKAIECRRAAAMVISSLIKGLGNEIIELKDDLLPIYRTLRALYDNNDEDSVLRLHAQLALEELNDIIEQKYLYYPLDNDYAVHRYHLGIIK